MLTQENVQNAAQGFIGAIKRKMPFFLASIIIISGLIDDNIVNNSIVAFIKISMGLFIIFDPKRNLMRSVGFYALSLGLARIVSTLPMLGSESDLFFIVALVMLGMGINLVVSGYSYLQDVSRGRFGMTFGSAALAIIMALSLIMMITTPDDDEYGLNAGYMLVYSVYLIQYLLILLIMDSDEFRFSSWQEKSVRKLDNIRLSYSLTPGTQISREDARIMKHMFDDRASWTPVDDGGPVECEKRIRLVDEKVSTVMIMQKWKGSDKIHITISTSNDGTILQANRFYVTEVSADDADDEKFMNLRIYSDGAMISNFSVIAPMEVAA